MKQSEIVADKIRDLAAIPDLDREVHKRLSFNEMLQLLRILNRVSPTDEAVVKGGA